MADKAHEETDRKLEDLERRIQSAYREAYQDLEGTVNQYFRAFEVRDKEQRALMESGEITRQQYTQWRLTQIGRGKRFEALRDQVAQRMTRANETAAAYVNDATPGIYSLNRNYAVYTIEQAAGDVGFTLWDEAAVRRLIQENPGLMPSYPEARAVRRGIDLAWGRKQITAQVTSGILQGAGIGKIARQLQQNITDMNRTSAVRAARTAVTGAQNAGRQDAYLDAAQMGIKLRKRWVATKDGRTRHTHQVLDGQTVETDKPFTVEGREIMYPGDPAAAPDLVYNCRCTMRTVEQDGIEAEPRMMRVRDPETGRNIVVEEMSYEEWKRRKSGKSAGGGRSAPGVPEQVGTVDFSDEKAVIQRLAEAEKELSGLNYEVNYTVTTDGRIWRVSGEAGTVNPSAIPSSLSGSYSYHNHPAAKTWYSFSAEDTAFFIESGEAYSKASDDLYEYVMRRTSETVAKPYDEVYHRFGEIRNMEIQQLKWDEIIDPDMDEYHEVIKILSRELKFEYERKKKGK